VDIQEGQKIFQEARDAVATGEPSRALPLLRDFLKNWRDDWRARLELARALYLDGQLESARETLVALSQDPECQGEAVVWSNLGAVLGELGDLRGESEAYRKGGASVGIEVTFNLGLQAVEKGDEKALRNILSDLVRQEGKEGSYSLWLKGLQAELGEDFEGALDAYRGVQREKAKQWQLGYNLARCVLSLGRPREAVQELQAARNQGGDRWEFRLLEGSALLALDDLKGAREAFEAAISLAPSEEPLPHFNLGMMLLESGDPAAASGFLKRASGLAPGDSEIRLALARARFSAGRYAQAAEVYRKIVEDDPSHFRAVYNLAYSLERTGSPSEALSTYEKALARRPGHYKTMNKIARLHLKKGDIEKALRTAERSLAQEHQENAEGYLVLGTVLKSQARIVEAARALEVSVLQDGSQSGAWKELAFCQRQLDRPGEAKESAKRAYALDPKDPDVLMELGLAYLALASQSDLAKSRRAFQELLERSPKSAKALAGLAQVSLLLDSPEEAHQAACKAVQAKGGYRAYAALGGAYLRLRKPRKAVDAFKRCLGRNKGYAPACDGISEAYRDLGESQKEEKYRNLAQRLRSKRGGVVGEDVTALVSMVAPQKG
jgi:tetratricopeptide (TPR) repeat protein